MTEEEALKRMVAPGQPRRSAWRHGIIQIHLTRACDRACAHCTQMSNWRKRSTFITPENFELACLSLTGYFGVVGIFGGNPVLHPQFEDLMEIYCKYVPYEQRGIWCNHPKGKGKLLSKIFNPTISNLNVHQSQEAYDEFKRDWPLCEPVGLEKDSSHSPVYGSMKDLGIPEDKRWELISRCDINQYWSAMIGEFRGEARAWFCEIAGAQSMWNQDNPEYPDTGVVPFPGWWQQGMVAFLHQVKKHCHDGCLVPLRGQGQLANSPDKEIVGPGYEPSTKTGVKVYNITTLEELSPENKIITNYLGT